MISIMNSGPMASEMMVKAHVKHEDQQLAMWVESSNDNVKSMSQEGLVSYSVIFIFDWF